MKRTEFTLLACGFLAAGLGLVFGGCSQETEVLPPEAPSLEAPEARAQEFLCARSINDHRLVWPDYLNFHTPARYPPGTFELIDVCAPGYLDDIFFRVSHSQDQTENLRIYVWDNVADATLCWLVDVPESFPTLLGYCDGITLQVDKPFTVTITPNPLHPEFYGQLYISGNGLAYAPGGYQMVWGYADDPPDLWERP